MSDVLLKMSNIEKSFSGVKALENAGIELKCGEVHALIGENGAGKSTLMKILTGIYSKDSGTVLYEGREICFTNPREAQDAGIVIVHQELNMCNELSVAQNLFLGREAGNHFIDDNQMNNDAKEIFSQLNIDLNPRIAIGRLTVGKQQMVEIAKAISANAKIIVFDEPTAALTDNEIEDLFKIIRDLKKKGIGIIYITHRMDEIKKITDRVTVMRDGNYIGTVDSKTTTKNEIIQMMVGRTIYEDPKSKSNVEPNAPVVLSVKHLNAGKLVKDVSFDLHKGEILGFSGLMGAGRTETARALFGADPKESGEVYVNGNQVDIKNPQDAIKVGIGYLSEDRKRYGVILEQSIAINSVIASLENYCKGLIDYGKIHSDAQKCVDALRIKTPSVEQNVVNLSGGNQQKVVIAKWLIRDSEILIFDEPTRGIDVGAKAEIYTLMNNLVKSGKSIIMISSEMTEILRMSDRIVVMCEGRKTGELNIEDATQEKIMEYATVGID